MARIDLDDPYVAFLESQVRAGLYNTISEAARDAIRKQMEAHELRRLASIQAELIKGESAIAEGQTTRYSDGLLDRLAEEGRKKAKEGKSIRNAIKP